MRSSGSDVMRTVRSVAALLTPPAPTSWVEAAVGQDSTPTPWVESGVGQWRVVPLHHGLGLVRAEGCPHIMCGGRGVPPHLGWGLVWGRGVTWAPEATLGEEHLLQPPLRVTIKSILLSLFNKL